jgi:hypothetical protein
MDAISQSLEIRLDDGRAIIARPRPEDQDFLRQSGGEVQVSLAESDLDTAGHSLSAEIAVDVEGHAMTLRLPTPADAEALRRALLAGALTATVVVAGAIAAMQPQSAPVTSGAAQPVARPASAQDFQIRREQAVDGMLEAPAVVGQPGDIQIERIDRISAPGQEEARPDFQTRREQAADRLLEAPAGEAPAASQEGASSQRVGGPQD